MLAAPAAAQVLTHPEKVVIRPPTAQQTGDALTVYGGITLSGSVTGSGAGLSPLNCAAVSACGGGGGGATLPITFSMWSSNGCTVNQVPTYNGSAWVCGESGGTSESGNETITGSWRFTQPTVFGEAITGQRPVHIYKASGDAGIRIQSTQSWDILSLNGTPLGLSFLRVSGEIPLFLEDGTDANDYRVGIGTTDPDATLDVHGDAIVTGTLTPQGTIGDDLVPSVNDAYDLGTNTAKWQTAWISTIEAVLFAENTAQINGGYFIIARNSGTFAAQVGASDTTIDLGKTHTPLPQWMEVRARDSGGTIRTEYLSIDSLVSGTTYNVTRNLAGGAVTWTWPQGTAYLVRGVEGDGRIELYAGSGVPRIDVMTQGATYSAQNDLIRIGGLTGMPGVPAGKYGIYIGDSTSYLNFYDSTLTVKGTLRASTGWFGTDASNALVVEAGGLYFISGGADIAIRSSNSISYGSGSGFWLGLDDGTAKFHIGNSANAWLSWTAADGLAIKDSTTTRALWATNGDLTIGEVASGKGNLHVTASSGTLALRMNTTVKGQFEADGDFIFGDTTESGSYLKWDNAAARLIVAGDVQIGARGNLLANTEFLGGTSGWTASYYDGDSGEAVSAFAQWTGGSWCPGTSTSTNCGYIQHAGTPPLGNAYHQISSDYVSAQGGRYYELSAYVGQHRGDASSNIHLIIDFYDAVGAHLGNGLGLSTCAEAGGQRLDEDWCRATLYPVLAPALTAYAQVSIRQYLCADVGCNDPYLFVTRVFFAEASQFQKVASPYSGIQSTMGGKLSALSVNTGSLTVDNALTVGSTGYIVGGATSYSSGTGFFLGYSSGYKFRIGTTSGNRMTWDGSNLRIYGTVYAGTGDNITLDGDGITMGTGTGTGYGIHFAGGFLGYNGSLLALQASGAGVDAEISAPDVVTVSGGSVRIEGLPYASTTSDLDPIVYDTASEQWRNKTDGISTGCAGNEYLGGITVESGIITAGTCTIDDIGSSEIDLLITRLLASPRLLQALGEAIRTAPAYVAASAKE